MAAKLQSFPLSIALLFVVTLKAETLVYDGSVAAPAIIECTDASTPCFISCTVDSSCSAKEIHCHRTAQQPCSIHLGTRAAVQAHILAPIQPTQGVQVMLEEQSIHSSYFTHRAPTVNITAIGSYAIYWGVIYAHEALKSKLFLEVSGTHGFESGTVFAPVGEGSLLNVNCKDGGRGCYHMQIYDDWTTEVRVEAKGANAQALGIRNMFDHEDSPLNISRSDTNYIGLNSAYRAPVFLSGFATQSFQGMAYFGHNHGDLTLYGAADASFSSASIEATADIPPYNRSNGYNIKLITTSSSGRAFTGITLNASQCARGWNIYAESRSYSSGAGALSQATIYARNANSVEIHCKEGGSCNDLTVECPYNNCTISCDDQTDCSNMKIYTCSRAALICDGIGCNFAATKVFCGFNQNETFYDADSGEFLCRNYSAGVCINELYPSTNPTNPSLTPTFSPSRGPSAYPSTNPTDNPSLTPTFSPSRGPSAFPSTSPSTDDPTPLRTVPNAVITNYEISIEIKNCDYQISATQTTSSTACAVDPDAVDDMVDTVQSVDDNVDIVSVDIVSDDLMIRLSITTDPTKVLTTDVISSHIEREVRDNDDDIFGDVEVVEKDPQFNNIINKKDKDMKINPVVFVGSVTGVVFVVCLCGLCVAYLFCQRRKTEKELINAVRMASMSGEKVVQETEDITNNRGEGDAVGDATIEHVLQTPMPMQGDLFMTGDNQADVAMGAVEHEDETEDDSMYDNYDNDPCTTTTTGAGASDTTTDAQIVNPDV
eukprot:627808_1